MTQVDRTSAPIAEERGFVTGQRAAEQQPQWRDAQEINVGSGERGVSIAAGAILALLGLSRRSLPGILIGGVGAGLIYRGVTGHCHLYQALEIDTAHGDPDQREGEIAQHSIHIEQAMLINRSPEELYRYWRDFQNLPRIMSNLQDVQVLDDRRSRWVSTAPGIAGGSVQWDAEITQDEPNTRIRWRSLPGSDVDQVGEIRFSPGLGDRGTEVHVYLEYVPPAGRLGHWIAKMFGKSPQRQIREDLRNFKRMMEVGELPTTLGQPRGTCTGRGKREE